MKNLKTMFMCMALISFMSLQAQEQMNLEQVVILSKIQLFYYQDCPYCAKVTLFLQSQNLLDQIECMDAGLPENRELLRSISGKTQAPYIVDQAANVKMAESNDIIEYFVKKYNIQLLAPVAATQLSSQESNGQKSYNPATFIAEVQAFKKPVIILVSTTWCPPCKIFKPLFLQVAQQFSDRCEFICVDGDANMSIVQELGIECYPSIVCYKNGQQINPENYRSKDGLLRLIDQLLQA